MTGTLRSTRHASATAAVPVCQLRYPQTRADMPNNGKSSTIVLPLSLDLVRLQMEAFPSKRDSGKTD
ncbi:MAG: hypothetical protein ABI227_14505 [Rhodanobacter sp.]